MDESTDKKKFVIPIITFLIGVIIGSVLTLLFFPNECPNCEIGGDIVEELSVEKSEEVESDSSTIEVELKEQPIVSESNVSLPVSQCSVVVDISGAVNEPGVYCFADGAKIVDAVKKADGFVKEVAYKYVAMKINLSELITNHQKIYIPFEEDVYCEVKNLQYIDVQENPVQQTEANSNQSDSTQSCININTATKEQLTSLNGVGESTAEKIIDGRPYSKVEDILNVSGIGESTYDKFKDDICVY